ncbi:MAG: hypothetical protein KDM64_18595, partial [Verrucomicrobiae bacterium]|nr:hypothetical protein [Verrucomicrobiae bacterium]
MPAFRTFSLPSSGRLAVLALAALWLALPAAAWTADWTVKGGESIPGELKSFEFSEKRAVFETGAGETHTVPAEELSADSRWRLLVSPQFAQSFPA